jgi:hypothetical protein
MGTLNAIKATAPGRFRIMGKGLKWTLSNALMKTKETAFDCALYCQVYSKCLSFSFGNGECRTVGNLTSSMNASLLITDTDHIVFDLVYV